MPLNWHQKAARTAAQHPHWTWSQVCAEVAKGRRRVTPKPTVKEFTAKLEQQKLF